MAESLRPAPESMGGGASGRPRRPLFRTFYWAFLILTLVALLPLGLFLSGRLRSVLESEIAERQRGELMLLGNALAQVWPAGEATPDRMDPIVDGLARGTPGRVTLVALDGRVLGDSERSGPALLAMENHALRPEVERALAGGEGMSTRKSATVQVPFLYRARLLRGPEDRPLAVVRLAFTRAGIEAEERTALRALLAALGLSLAVALGLAAVLSRRLVRPIGVLRRSAEEMSHGGLGREVRLRTGDELEELALALNRMSRDLARQQGEILGEKERLLGVLEGMVEGVLVTDREGRIVQTNGALQQMFGLARAPVGRTALEALRSASLDEILERALRWQQRGGAAVRISHPAERHLEVEVAPLGRDGRAHGAVAVFHDVTRLVKLEGVRRDFAANVSHEIRTPVTAIRGYAETLRSGAGGPDERERFAEIIIRHADRLTELIDDLLALSSFESEGYRLEVRQVEVEELLRAAEEAFRPRASEKGLLLEVEPAPPDLSLRGDRKLLDQVLSNLVDNAIEHTDPGGQVRLRAEREDDRAILRVTDTGAGIPAADLDRVFERFFRVDRARSRKRGGTGLGLAIVKHIVLLHGGDVWVESRVGQGSEFAVRLPLAGPSRRGRDGEGASRPEGEMPVRDGASPVRP